MWSFRNCCVTAKLLWSLLEQVISDLQDYKNWESASQVHLPSEDEPHPTGSVRSAAWLRSTHSQLPWVVTQVPRINKVPWLTLWITNTVVHVSAIRAGGLQCHMFAFGGLHTLEWNKGCMKGVGKVHELSWDSEKTKMEPWVSHILAMWLGKVISAGQP